MLCFKKVFFLLFAFVTSGVALAQFSTIGKLEDLAPVNKPEKGCVKDEKEPSRKVCANIKASSYVKQNFYTDVGLELDAAGVQCNWNLPITAGASGKDHGIVCESSDPKHKILIGWKKIDFGYGILQGQIATNEYDRLGKKKMSEGYYPTRCLEAQYHEKILGGKTSAKCTVDMVDGSQNNFIVTYFQPNNVKARIFFIAVVGLNSSVKYDDLEGYVLMLK